MEMIVRSLTLIVICCGLSVQCFNLEPIDFVDFVDHNRGVRSYPVLKVSFFNPKNEKKAAVHSKLIKHEKANQISGELVDNVREFKPTSREDIRKLKKLTFHGRSSPRAIMNSTNAKSPVRLSPPPPTQVDYQQRKYVQQQSINRSTPRSKKAPSKLNTPIDNGFLPLMRPSPINVYPPDPPSFQTMRNYVDYLKLRQKEFFSDLQEVEALQAKDLPSEVDYFVKQEKELAEEQQLSPEHRQNEDLDIDEIDNRTDEDEDDESSAGDNESTESEEEKTEEESKRHEKFVPFRMYAQVRHAETENHKPKSEAPSRNAKEKLTLEKKNVYYKEEGYEEKDYDHGSEKVDKKYRAKRSVDHSNRQGSEVTLKHLDRLLKNSSLYLPDEDDVPERRRLLDTVYGNSKKNNKSHKYPYYNLPDNTLSTMSAFRYSENIKNFPRDKESLYSYKNVRDCEEIEDDVNPVPDNVEEEGTSTNYNEKPRRLRNLGDKINCYKTKYFGEDPFDNPLFKEETASASIPIPSKYLAHQANPLITVYGKCFHFS